MISNRSAVILCTVIFPPLLKTNLVCSPCKNKVFIYYCCLLCVNIIPCNTLFPIGLEQEQLGFVRSRWWGLPSTAWCIYFNTFLSSFKQTNKRWFHKEGAGNTKISKKWTIESNGLERCSAFKINDLLYILDVVNLSIWWGRLRCQYANWIIFSHVQGGTQKKWLFARVERKPKSWEHVFSS